MTLPDSRSFHRVVDARQAALLTDPTSKKFFAPFLAQDRTVREAAQMVGCALSTMLYRVKVMVAAGLLRVVEVRPRAGRAVKVYRSVHDAYFVPFGVTPYATLEERVTVQGQPLFARLTSAYAAALRAHGLSGNALLLGENGAVWTTDLPPEVTRDGQPLVFLDMTVHLDGDRAHRAARQLSGTFREALGAPPPLPGPEHAPPPGAHRAPQVMPYVMMVALIPLRDDA